MEANNRCNNHLNLICSWILSCEIIQAWLFILGSWDFDVFGDTYWGDLLDLCSGPFCSLWSPMLFWCSIIHNVVLIYIFSCVKYGSIYHHIHINELQMYLCCVVMLCGCAWIVTFISNFILVPLSDKRHGKICKWEQLCCVFGCSKTQYGWSRRAGGVGTEV